MSRSFSSRRPVTMTSLAPALQKASAVAAPMPAVAPVMSTRDDSKATTGAKAAPRKTEWVSAPPCHSRSASGTRPRTSGPAPDGRPVVGLVVAHGARLREHADERRAEAGPRGARLEPAAVAFGDAAADEQAEAGAWDGDLLHVGLPERHEHAAALLLAEAQPVVLDLEADLLGVAAVAHRDVPFLRRVLHGVRDQ